MTQRIALVFALCLMSCLTLADACIASTGSIQGTVTDAVTHAPVADVPVCAVFGRYSDDEERFCTQSDGSGIYEVADLRAADYAVEFLPGTAELNYMYEAWNDQHVWVLADDVSVGQGPVGGIDAELIEGGEIRGRVIDGLRALPVPGVQVCAESVSSINVEEGCATTDEDGRYTIYGLAASDFAVEFWARPGFVTQYWSGQPDYRSADPVLVVPGDVAENVDAVLLPAARISGQVTDALTGGPVPDVTACVFEVSTEFIDECGETEAAGHYVIAGVAPGRYMVRLFTDDPYPPAWYTGSLCEEEAAVITAEAGHETEAIDIQLMPEPFFPDCSPPTSPRSPTRLLEVLDLWSRANGAVAVKLRNYRAGILNLTAQTSIGSDRARRAATVGVKRKGLPGAGVRIVNLGLNRRGRILRRERGRLRVHLAITLVTHDEALTSLARSTLFRTPKHQRPGSR